MSTPHLPPGCISAREAAQRLASVMTDLDPALWLVDLRRTGPKYRRRITRPPLYRRGLGGRIVYSEADILRVIAELASGAPT